MEHKIQHKTRRLSRPFWSRLGPVLGRFGVDLGVKNNEISKVLQRFREHRVFEENKTWKCILDRSWVDFGAKRGPKRLPNRTPDGANMVSKNDNKNKIGF